MNPDGNFKIKDMEQFRTNTPANLKAFGAGCGKPPVWFDEGRSRRSSVSRLSTRWFRFFCYSKSQQHWGIRW
jgi:hypothetical protein